MKIVRCLTDHRQNPVGFEMKSHGNPEGYPLFSWEVTNAVSKRASEIRIQIALDEEFLTIVHDTGSIKNYRKNSLLIPFEGEACTRYYWKVSVTTEADGTAESPVQYYETTKQEQEWQAHWIGCPELNTENPVFIKKIAVENDTDARLYICGLGVYEVYLNGTRCSDEYLAPGSTEYERWIQYQTYPLCLKQGENELRVSLGNGWYRGRFGLMGNKAIYGERFALICELIEFQSKKLLAVSDASWSVTLGRSIFNNLYDGEELGDPFDEEKLYPVSILEGLAPEITKKLTPRLSPPVRIHEVFDVAEVLHTPAGETVLDFGQNMAGFVRFDADERKGALIRLQYGEILQDGCFYRENLRSARAEFRYHGAGFHEKVQPHFTYYGFRYVKVEGLTRPAEDYHFQACALYSDLRSTGTLYTGHAKVNQLLSNISWGQKSNYVDVPTDCPQRDERLGWTADTQVFAGAACYLMDSYPFLEKYCRAIYETQLRFGYVTNTVPAFEDHQPTCAGWGDAAVLIPWTLYRFYGDVRILADQYQSMKQWVDSVYALDEQNGGSRLWKTTFGYGDWLARDNDDPAERMVGGTELTYVSSAYYYWSTSIVAEAAGILGLEEAAIYKSRAAEIKRAIQQEYFTPTGRLAVNTQTGYVLALNMKLCPEGTEQRVADDLHQKLTNCKMHLKTGFVGTAYIMKVLSEYGYHEDACRLLLNEDVPSWLYAVNMGATTLWERWDSLLPNGKVNGTDMNSFNHYASGAVAEWIYGYLAGIRQDDEIPGFAHAVIQPMPNRYLKELSCSYQSAAGTYESQWKFLPGKRIYIKVTIPFGASAKLILPYSTKSYELESGTYEYEYLREHDGTENINTDMPFSELRKLPEVQPILSAYFPDWADIPETFAGESIRSLAKLPYFQVEEQALDHIDREIRKYFMK